jgi:hypothetical protein
MVYCTADGNILGNVVICAATVSKPVVFRTHGEVIKQPPLDNSENKLQWKPSSRKTIRPRGPWRVVIAPK